MLKKNFQTTHAIVREIQLQFIFRSIINLYSSKKSVFVGKYSVFVCGTLVWVLYVRIVSNKIVIFVSILIQPARRPFRMNISIARRCFLTKWDVI